MTINNLDPRFGWCRHDVTGMNKRTNLERWCRDEQEEVLEKSGEEYRKSATMNDQRA